MDMDYTKLKKHIGSIPYAIVMDLEERINTLFDRCGLYYRIFSRCKSPESTVMKMQVKNYAKEGKHMQDLIGVRIALYFKDDIDVCVKIIQDNYRVVEIVYDQETSDKFCPTRLNIVCRMPDDIADQFDSELWEFPIDRTFEVQIRTVFSEGWHEVEHDLRYKNQKDWIEHLDLSRSLNGVYATLETCDWVIINICNAMAYSKYKNGDWSSMLRNHLRIHFKDSAMSPELTKLLDNDQNLAKELFRCEREPLLLCLSNKKMISFPRTMSNIVFLINELSIHNECIFSLTPPLLKKRLEESLTVIGDM